jgi:hypothetical protein
MFSFTMCSLLLLSGGDDSASLRTTGTKMTVRYNSNGFESEETVYFRADVRRRESREVTARTYGPRLAFIERCDLAQVFDLNLDLRQFDSYPYPPNRPTKEQLAKMDPSQTQAVPPGPSTSRIEVTTADTGERRDFFGHPARHVITTSKETPLEGSHRYAEEIVRDGWYIDLKTEITCEPWWRKRGSQNGFAYLTSGNIPERIEYVAIGDPETGLAVESKTVVTSTFVLKDGSTKDSTSKSRTSIIDFAEGPLDAGLFEVPAGFKQVQRINRNQPEGVRSAVSVGWQQFVLTMEDLFR